MGARISTTRTCLHGGSYLVTVLFHANVDAHGGAYATGLLVLITSAALAVTLNVWKQRWLRYAFVVIAFIFTYTTALNIYKRPEGDIISSLFILTIIVTSFVSRAVRSTELRITRVDLSQQGGDLLAEDKSHAIRSSRTALELAQKKHLRRN